MTDFREDLAAAVRSALYTTDALWQYGHPKRLAPEDRLDRMTASLVPAIIAALPESIREAIDLGLAFAEAESACPEGTVLEWLNRLPKGGWNAEVWAAKADMPYTTAEGPTLAAALVALTARLRAAK